MKLALLCILLIAQPIWADEPAEKAQPAKSTQNQTGPAYLGVRIHPVPELLRAQMPQKWAGQGVLVIRVIPHSPAAQAGIQKNDILLSFNGQALNDPRTLIQSVRQAGAGNQAEVQLLRHGQLINAKVQLAAHPSYQRRMNPPQRAQVWESFESFSISKNADDQYTVKFELLDPNGDKKSFQYQGDRDQVREQIQKEKALSAAQKERLLNALSDRMPMPPMPDFRRLEREMFRPFDQWFRNDFFRDDLTPPWFSPYYRR